MRVAASIGNTSPESSEGRGGGPASASRKVLKVSFHHVRWDWIREIFSGNCPIVSSCNNWGLPGLTVFFNKSPALLSARIFISAQGFFLGLRGSGNQVNGPRQTCFIRTCEVKLLTLPGVTKGLYSPTRKVSLTAILGGNMPVFSNPFGLFPRRLSRLACKPIF